VLKGEPTNLEEALNFATKYEAYKSSLVSQGTLSQTSADMSTSEATMTGQNGDHVLWVSML